MEQSIQKILPQLSKSGYLCKPDVNELMLLSEAILSKIPHFEIIRENVGKIEWEDVDIRGVNFDEIVSIELLAVSVYEGVKNVPPIGTKLNKSAIVTFQKAWPKDRNSNDKLNIYEEKLKRFCGNHDARFLSYECESGVWRFEVSHFSKYGFVESDSEEDERIHDDSKANEEKKTDSKETNHNLLAKPLNFDSEQSIRRLKNILCKDNPNNELQEPYQDEKLSKFTVTSSYQSEYDRGLNFRNNFIRQKCTPVKMKFEEDISFHLKYRKFFNQNVKSFPDCISFFLPEQSPTIRELISVKQIHIPDFSTSQPGSTTKSLELQCRHHLIKSSIEIKKTDLLLFFGRSFRVGWSKDGRIAHSGRLINNSIDENFNRTHRISIEHISPYKWNMASFRYPSPQNTLESCLKQMFIHSKRKSIGDLTFWSLPTMLNSIDISECNHYDECLKGVLQILKMEQTTSNHPDTNLLHSISLLDSLFGQEKAMNQDRDEFDYIPPYNSRSQYPECLRRRSVQLSNWFEYFLQNESQQVTSTENGYSDIFDCLTTSRDIEKAIKLLMQRGSYRLASLVAQITSNIENCDLLRNQLNLWSSMDAINTIDPSLLQIYLLLAGWVKIPHDQQDRFGKKSILKGLGWKRAFASLYWFLPYVESQDDRLSTVLNAYNNAILDDDVDRPCSPFIEQQNFKIGANVDYPNVEDGVFSLIQLLCAVFGDGDLNEELIVRALQPQGYTRDELDYHTSYVICQLLNGVGAVTDSKYFLFSSLRQNLIFQLVSEGQWPWAVFVALQVPSGIEKDNSLLLENTQLVKSLLQHFSDQIGRDEIQFLQESLLLPDEIIFEALSYRYGYEHRQNVQLKYLSATKLIHDEAKLLCLDFNSNELSSRTQIQQYLHKIDQLQAKISSDLIDKKEKLWIDLLKLIGSYLEIKDVQEEFAAERNTMETLDEQDFPILMIGNEIVEKIKQILMYLSEFERNETQQNYFSKFYPEFKLFIKTIGTDLFRILAKIELNSQDPEKVGVSLSTLSILSEQVLTNSTPLDRSICVENIEIINQSFLRTASNSLVL
jgi:nuclear pore complex protein Nup98-Nup96